MRNVNVNKSTEISLQGAQTRAPFCLTNFGLASLLICQKAKRTRAAQGGNMKIKSRFVLPLALCAGLSSTALSHAATWLKTGASTSRPYGHIAYCAGKPGDCAKRSKVSKPAAVGLATLQSVNSSVNRSIKPVKDQTQFGVRDKWLSSTKAGDCEDYALAKRAALQRRGISKSNLLLAVGRANGEAHTVLVVRTNSGDFVMDNLNDTVLPVSSSRIGIRKIQSPIDGSDWLSVTGKTNSPL
jgi:predicted transglutaminase-like cysteine proteinase